MADEKNDSRYPAKRYHATKNPRYVQNEAEEADLGPGWFDSPKTAAAAKTGKKE